MELAASRNDRTAHTYSTGAAFCTGSEPTLTSPQQEVEEKWKEYIQSNFLFYTVLFEQFLEMISGPFFPASQEQTDLFLQALSAALLLLALELPLTQV
jgi:hypothetical protein